MRIDLHRAQKNLERNSDTILIIGDGRTMTDDVKSFLRFKKPHDSAALGRAVREYPGIVNHWFNADGETAIHWAKTLPEETIRHTLGAVEGFDVDWDLTQDDYHYQEITNEAGRMHGSSALFATLASLHMGYESVILAGCPLDAEGHYYFEPSKETLGPIWLGFDFMAWLDFAQLPDAAKVRSMSGYTAKILGGLRYDMQNL